MSIVNLTDLIAKRAKMEPGEEEAIAWFNQLSPSQRRRLALRC